MSVKPLLSVVIPTHNTEKYIERCLRSVVEQTYSNLEIVIVDDCSVDNTWEICNNLAKNDSRIKIVKLKDNVGPGAARNIGLAQASGEFVTFVDSDDWIDADTYETAMAESVKGEYDIVQFAYYENKDRYSDRDRIVFSSKEALDRLVNHKDVMTWSVWNKVFSAKAIKDINYDTDIYYGEDVLYIQKVLKNANDVLILRCSKYHHSNENEKSVSRSARNFYDLPEFRRRFSEGYKEIGGRVYELACAEYFEVLLSFYLDACVNSDSERMQKLKIELKTRRKHILSNKSLPFSKRLEYTAFFLLGSRISIILRKIKVRDNGRCR